MAGGRLVAGLRLRDARRIDCRGQRNNDDLAAAIARVQEADAQARIAGAALLPSLDPASRPPASARRSRGVGPRVFNTFNPDSSASYELDFWGKNRALRGRRARQRPRPAATIRQTVALTVVSSVATTYFQALEFRDRIAGRAAKSRQRPENPQGLAAANNRAGIGHGTRCRAARDRGGAVERRDAAAAAAVSPDRVRAGRARSARRRNRSMCDTGTLDGSVQPGGGRGLAVTAAARAAPTSPRRNNN